MVVDYCSRNDEQYKPFQKMLPRTTVNSARAKYKKKWNIFEESFAQKLAKITCFWKKKIIGLWHVGLVKKKRARRFKIMIA